MAVIRSKQQAAVPLRRAWEAWNPQHTALLVPRPLLLLFVGASALFSPSGY